MSLILNSNSLDFTWAEKFILTHLRGWIFSWQENISISNDSSCLKLKKNLPVFGVNMGANCSFGKPVFGVRINVGIFMAQASNMASPWVSVPPNQIRVRILLKNFLYSLLECSPYLKKNKFVLKISLFNFFSVELIYCPAGRLPIRPDWLKAAVGLKSKHVTLGFALMTS